MKGAKGLGFRFRGLGFFYILGVSGYKALMKREVGKEPPYAIPKPETLGLNILVRVLVYEFLVAS